MLHPVRYNIPEALAPFVNCIFYGEATATNAHTHLPLYADGYPGIMFQQAPNGFFLLPKGKALTELFLYGQTIEPIALEAKGPHKFVVFQLYPFASKYLLGIDPKVLNDDCYDLLTLDEINIQSYYQQLKQADSLEIMIDWIAQLMLQLIAYHAIPPNDQIQKAIAQILAHKGQIKISTLLQDIYLSERSFERQFKAQVGLTPKQFAKIIQFQTSIHYLNESKFKKLTEVGLESGFTDQSHFIKTFKTYTGQTPSFYLQQSNS